MPALIDVDGAKPGIYLLQALPEQLSSNSLPSRRLFVVPARSVDHMTATPMEGATLASISASSLHGCCRCVAESPSVLLLEFGLDALLAEATLTQLGVKLSRQRFCSSSRSLDRGVPASP